MFINPRKYTYYQFFHFIPNLEGLNISIVGDISHSKVARSDIIGFSKIEAHVTICAPQTIRCQLLCPAEGNFREFENLVERSVSLSSTNIILPESLTISMHKKRRWIEGIKGQRFDLEDVAQGV